MSNLRYNIWHIEMYAGWSNCDGPADCNIKGDYIFDSRFDQKEVIDMMVSKYNDGRCVEVWKCECIKSDQKLWLEDI